jgi:hypothetical protein
VPDGGYEAHAAIIVGNRDLAIIRAGLPDHDIDVTFTRPAC